MCLAVISVTHEIAPTCSVAARHIRDSTDELAEFKAVTAAEVLGDTVETVLHHYTHLRRASVVVTSITQKCW